MAASPPNEARPWDLPEPGTLERNVHQAKPALPPSLAPVQAAQAAATLIPEDGLPPDSVVQPAKLAPARPQIDGPRVPKAPSAEDTVVIDFSDLDEPSDPSMETLLDLEERRLLRPRRLRMWALGFGLTGVVISVILAAVGTAVIVGTDLLGDLQDRGSLQSALPPLAEAQLPTPTEPAPAQAAKPPRPRAKRAAPTVQEAPVELPTPAGTAEAAPELPVLEAAIAGAGAVLDELEPDEQEPVAPVQLEELAVEDLAPPSEIAADEIEYVVEEIEEPVAEERIAPPTATLRTKMQAEPAPEE